MVKGLILLTSYKNSFLSVQADKTNCSHWDKEGEGVLTHKNSLLQLFVWQQKSSFPSSEWDPIKTETIFMQALLSSISLGEGEKKAGEKQERFGGPLN